MDENQVIGHFAANMDRLEQLKWFEANSASRSAKFSRKYSSKGLTLKMIFGIFALLIFHIFPVQAQNHDLKTQCGRYVPLDVLLAVGTFGQAPPVSQLGPSQLGPSQLGPSQLGPSQLGQSELAYPSPAYQSFVQPTAQPVEMVRHDPNSNGLIKKGVITSWALMQDFWQYVNDASKFLKNLTAFNSYIDGIIKKGRAGIIPKEILAFIALFGRYVPLLSLFISTSNAESCKLTRDGPNDITLKVKYGGKRRSTLRRRAR